LIDVASRRGWRAVTPFVGEIAKRFDVGPGFCRFPRERQRGARADVEALNHAL
jgi:hypothetical protein